MEKTLKELADYLGGTVIGDGSLRITGLAGLDDAKEGDITFLANPKYAVKVATTRATAVVLPPGADAHGRSGIEIANPYLAFAKLLTLATSRPFAARGVMAGAVAAMTKLGVDVKYIEVPGGNHGDVVVPNLPAIFDFFDTHMKK